MPTPKLLPDFVYRRYRAGERVGQLPAVALTVDIPGFTAMTEQLVPQGPAGAEHLSNQLNRLFARMFSAVQRVGGFPALFSGDGFTAIFPAAQNAAYALRAALTAAQTIQKMFEQPRVGTEALQVRLGVGAGEMECGIVGETWHTYYFRGPALLASMFAETLAEPNRVALSETCLAWLPAHELETTRMVSGAMQLERWHGVPVPPQAARVARQPRAALTRFWPEAVVDFNQQGEFRNVVPLFIEFDGLAETDLTSLETPAQVFAPFADQLLGLARQFSAYFNKLEFSLKGALAMLVLGAPIAYEDNIARALDLTQAIWGLMAHYPGLRLRAGLTYGPAYAGLVGNARNAEYTVLGDAVNLAARQMQQAPWGEVWVAAALRRQAYGPYVFEDKGAVVFKGKQHAEPVYALAGNAPTRPSVGAPLVGREAELAAAHAALAPLRTGPAQVGGVYVYGEAGIGKSRLIAELPTDFSDFEWWELPCDGMQGKGFYPFSQFLRQFFDQTRERTVPENRKHFAARFEHLLMRLQATDHTEVVALQSELERGRLYLAGFLGLAEAVAGYVHLDPQLRFSNTLMALRALFRALSRVRPLVLVVQDLHWMDADSLKAWPTVMADRASYPWLVLASSRFTAEGQKPRLPGERDWLELDLNALPAAGTLALARALLRADPGPRLRELLLTRTQGIPFFVEQLTRYVQESEMLLTTPKGVELNAAAEVQLPPTLNDMLVARLDRLNPRLRLVVQTAAVLGPLFDVTLLTAMLGELEREWSVALVEQQVQAGVVARIWFLTADTSYLFAHALLQDAAYHMQLPTHLRQLHRLAAITLTRLMGDDGRAAAEVAFHYERAQERAAALPYFIHAAAHARSTFALEVASGHYRHALDLLPTLPAVAAPQLNQIYEGLGSTLMWQARYAEALAAFGQWEAAAQARGDWLGQAQAVLGLARVQNYQDAQAGSALANACRAENILQVGLAQVSEAEPAPQLALIESLYFQGWAHYHNGEPMQALALGERITQLCLALGTVAQRALGQSYNLQAVAQEVLLQFAAAEQNYGRALALFQALGDKRNVGLMYNNLGDGANLRGDHVTALRYLQAGLQVLREVGSRDLEFLCLNNLAEARLGIGGAEAARTAVAELRYVIQQAQATHLFFLANTHLYLALAHLQLGELAEALPMAVTGLTLAQQNGNKRYQARAWRVLGQYGMLGGDLALAPTPAGVTPPGTPADYFAASAQLFAEVQHPLEQGRTLRVWASWLAAHGAIAQARTLRAQAAALFQRVNADHELARLESG